MHADDTGGNNPPVRGQDDIAVIGAGASGLMAAIRAGRSGAGKVVLLDRADRPGAKILVSGGGRCNVTHHAVTERDYAGGSPNAVRNILRRFGVEDTVRFFRGLGVELKQEDTGKLFPTTDRARTVLDALLGAATEAGVELHHPVFVRAVERGEAGLIVRTDRGDLHAGRVVLATGGKALPKSGSDGFGYSIARSLGHTVNRVFPALVPLVLEQSCPLRELSGVSVPARLEVRSGTSKRLARAEGPTLLTHFGLSGPAVLDISRHFLDAAHRDPDARLHICFLPDDDRAEIEAALLALGSGRLGAFLRARLPDRLAGVLMTMAGVDPAATGAVLRRQERRRLLGVLFDLPLPVTGDRGFTHAEATAGGVPLDEIDIKTMASRRCPGLYLCGEILDVDGRIGGFSFQWAWATGHIAGASASAAAAVVNDRPT